MARKKKGHDEEHINHERWLLTYADMITLLMCLFIILFAMSKLDAKKYDEMARSLAQGFGQVINISQGSMSVLPATGQEVTLQNAPKTDVMAVVSPNVMPPLVNQINAMMQSQAMGQNQQQAMATQAAVAAVTADKATLDKAQKALQEAINKAGLAGRVTLSREERGLVVNMLVDDVIFPADSAVLQPAGEKVIAALAPAIKETGHRVIIEGHTNTAKAHPKNYPSEWELSSARASSVARYLTSPLGLDHYTMSVVGYGDTSPLVPESNPNNMTINRRIAIVISTATTEQERNTAANAAADGSGPASPNLAGQAVVAPQAGVAPMGAMSNTAATTSTGASNG